MSCPVASKIRSRVRPPTVVSTSYAVFPPSFLGDDVLDDGLLRFVLLHRLLHGGRQVLYLNLLLSDRCRSGGQRQHDRHQ